MTANIFYHFDGDPEDEAAWQAFVAEHREQFPGGQKSVTTPPTAVEKLSELFLLFAVVVALVGTVLRQQAIREIEGLEAEVQRLEAELAAAAVAQGSSETAVTPAVEGGQLLAFSVIETDLFRFYVEPGYTAAVTPVAAQIDEEYFQLCMDLGLVPICGDDKDVVYVAELSEFYKANLSVRVGAIVIDMSPDTPWAASNRVDPVQLVHENLFGRLARRALDQAIDSRTIKPQWNTLVGNLYPHLTRRQFPKPVAELRSDEQQKRQYAQQLSPRLVEQTGNPGDWMYPQYDLARPLPIRWLSISCSPMGEGSGAGSADAERVSGVGGGRCGGLCHRSRAIHGGMLQLICNNIIRLTRNVLSKIAPFLDPILKTGCGYAEYTTQPIFRIDLSLKIGCGYAGCAYTRACHREFQDRS
ncbi:MAG: hypothetical protein R2932_04125 [Caldilineaceae bacterium]